MNQNDCYSSEEDDGDEKWRAAIHSAAAVDYIFSEKLKVIKTEKLEADLFCCQTQVGKAESKGLKLYQIRAQKLLDDMFEDSLEFVRVPSPPSNSQGQQSHTGIRLFSKAPPGIIFDSHDACPRPSKRPCIIPNKEIKEKSKEFKHRIRCATVDGAIIIAGAQEAARQSLIRYEASNQKIKSAAKREEERVAQLKKLRGEKWLPSCKRSAGKQVKSR